MDKQAKYSLRWRGRVTGPFSLNEIEERLDAHEVSLFHEVRHGGDWMRLEELLTRLKKPISSVPLGGSASAGSRNSESVSVGSGAGTGESGYPRRFRLFYAAMGMLFGCLGLHNFYARRLNFAGPQLIIGLVLGLGWWMRADLSIWAVDSGDVIATIWQIVAASALAVLPFAILASWFFALGETIVVWRDGNGRAMK